MAMDAGNSGCTTGLSARVYNYLVGDVRNGFSGTLTAAQTDSVKALCYAVSRAVVDEIAANAEGSATIAAGALSVGSPVGEYTVTVSIG